MESRARAGLPTIREIEYDCAVEIGLRCLSLCQKRDFLELFDHIYFVVFKDLVIELFFLTYKGVRFFSSITHHDRYIFRVSLRSRRLEKTGARKNGPATQAVSV